MRSNPPWADKIINGWRPRLESYFGKLSVPTTTSGDIHREYGCGYYGCAYPAPREGRVFKLTTDSSEAAFVVAALKLSKRARHHDGSRSSYWPDGMIRYYKVAELAGESRNRRKVYAITRDAASHVGGFSKYVLSKGASYREARDVLQAALRIGSLIRKGVFSEKDDKSFLSAAMKTGATHDENVEQVIRTRGASVNIGRWGGTKPYRLWKLVDLFGDILEFMENTAVVYTIGQAMKYYLQNGMVLSDVHEDNIGVVDIDDEYGGYSSATIIDPGHMVPIHPDKLSVKVPVLEK